MEQLNIPEPERQTQFIEELRKILHEETGHHLQINSRTTFKEIYKQLQPTFQNLQSKYELESNPNGTNTEIILFQSELFSKWYNTNIYSKKKYDPIQVLTEGLEKLFDNNTKYTYPDGRTIQIGRASCRERV